MCAAAVVGKRGGASQIAHKGDGAGKFSEYRQL